MRENKGFTLVEMLVTITILGIVTVIALPIISNISSTMNNRKIDVVEDDVLSASKLYIDSRGDDEFGNQESGCIIVPYSTLVSLKLIDDNALKEVGLDDRYKEGVFVKVRKMKDTYTYDIIFPRTEEELTEDIAKKAVAETECDIDTVGPRIEITPNETTGTIKSTKFNSEKKYVKVKIYDDYGLGKNISFTYTWYKSGSVFKTEKIDFNNEPMKPADGEEYSYLDYKIQLPKKSDGTFDSGTFTLKIHPENVWDAVGNFNTTDVDSGTYEFDNIPPTMVIKLYREEKGGKYIRPHRPVEDSILAQATNSDITLTNWSTHGYYIEFINSSDNFGITNQTWMWNASDNVSLNTDLSDSRKSIDSSATDKTLTAPGARYATVEMCDHAGNCTKHSIKVNISPFFFVEYDGNGADRGTTPTTTCYYNHDCVMQVNGFEKDNYKFVDWTMDGKNFAVGKTIKNYTTEHRKKYVAKANWKLNTFTVTYHVNDGAGYNENYTTKKVNYGDSIPTDPNPQSVINEYKKFDGWTGVPASMPDHDITVEASISNYMCRIITGYEKYDHVASFRNVIRDAGYPYDNTSIEYVKTGAAKYYHVVTKTDMSYWRATEVFNYLWNHTPECTGEYFLVYGQISCENGKVTSRCRRWACSGGKYC